MAGRLKASDQVELATKSELRTRPLATATRAESMERGSTQLPSASSHRRQRNSVWLEQFGEAPLRNRRKRPNRHHVSADITLKMPTATPTTRCTKASL